MTWIRPGPRPLAITLFSVAFLGAAILSYVRSLSALPVMQEVFALQFPWLAWDRDWTIVALSAKLSIAFIPVAMIYLRAIRLARWLVVIFSGITLLGLPRMVSTWAATDELSIGYLVEPILTLFALIILFTPGANRWFAQKKEPDLAVFD